MGFYSDLDVDRQESEGVFTVFAMAGVIGPIAGWVRVVRFYA